MKEYVNLYTGEVVTSRSILGARRYFKKDAKKYGLHYKRSAIITLAKYLASFQVDCLRQTEAVKQGL